MPAARKPPGRRKRKSEYKEYLKSAYWQAVRLAVLARDGRKCTNCGATNKLEIHHKSYAHRGQEHLYLNDLATLCHTCHKSHHNAEKARRSGRFQTRKAKAN